MQKAEDVAPSQRQEKVLWAGRSGNASRWRALTAGLPKAMTFINGQHEASPLLASCCPRYTLHLTVAGTGAGSRPQAYC